MGRGREGCQMHSHVRERVSHCHGWCALTSISSSTNLLKEDELPHVFVSWTTGNLIPHSPWGAMRLMLCHCSMLDKILCWNFHPGAVSYSSQEPAHRPYLVCPSVRFLSNTSNMFTLFYINNYTMKTVSFPITKL